MTMADHIAGAQPLTRYTKAVVSIVAAVLVALVAALTDDVVTVVEFVTVGIAGVTAVTVYLVPNLPTGPARYAKGITAFVGAGLSALVLIVADGVSLSEWLTVAVAALGGVGIVVLPNAPQRPSITPLPA
jgi:peptidoglycan/LPS O-acetylase OafA/YrhL